MNLENQVKDIDITFYESDGDDVQYDGSASFNLIRFGTPEDSPGPPNEIIVP